jgi:hypothetical protein
MRNLNNVEINSVSGGKEICGVQILKGGSPIFDLARVTVINGLNVTAVATDADLKTAVDFLQKAVMQGKNQFLIGTDSSGIKWSLLSICTTVADDL